MTATLVIAIVGALTGVLSLYLYWRQTRFALAFEGADLRYEPDVLAQLGTRSPESLDGTRLDFQVEVRLHNRGDGSGSIEKPRLQVIVPGGAVYEARPQTEEVRSEVLDMPRGMTGSRMWVERSGGSYFLQGQGRVDDVLDYTLKFSDGADALALLGKFDALAFNLLYRDHRGRDAREPITSRSKWDQLI